MGEYFLIILELAFLYFPLVLGAYVSISLMKVPDLSIEAAFVFGSIIAARSIPGLQAVPWLLYFIIVLCLAMLGGAIVGLVSASLTRFARIPHLLSSILTIGLFHGINQYVLGVANFSLSRYINPLISTTWLYRHPELVALGAIFFVLTVAGWFWLRTQLGYACAIYGNNPQFFQHYGISTNYVFFAGIVLSNALAGLAGYCVAHSSGFADINAGFGMALFSVTCLILGKTFVPKKIPFTIFAPVLGVVVYFTLQQLLLKVGFNLKYFTMIQSLIVLVILIIRYRKMQGKKAGIDNLGV